MKEGDLLECRFCRREIFVKSKVLMSGWEQKGKVLYCPLCEKVLSEVKENEIDSEITVSQKSLSGLESLLGETQKEKKTLQAEEGDLHFCRNCKHYIVHPFKNMCGLLNIPKNPMDDCSSFEKKK